MNKISFSISVLLVLAQHVYAQKLNISLGTLYHAEKAQANSIFGNTMYFEWLSSVETNFYITRRLQLGVASNIYFEKRNISPSYKTLSHVTGVQAIYDLRQLSRHRISVVLGAYIGDFCQCEPWNNRFKVKTYYVGYGLQYNFRPLKNQENWEVFLAGMTFHDFGFYNSLQNTNQYHGAFPVLGNITRPVLGLRYNIGEY